MAEAVAAIEADGGEIVEFEFRDPASSMVLQDIGATSCTIKVIPVSFKHFCTIQFGPLRQFVDDLQAAHASLAGSAQLFGLEGEIVSITYLSRGQVAISGELGWAEGGPEVEYCSLRFRYLTDQSFMGRTIHEFKEVLTAFRLEDGS